MHSSPPLPTRSPHWPRDDAKLRCGPGSTGSPTTNRFPSCGAVGPRSRSANSTSGRPHQRPRWRGQHERLASLTADLRELTERQRAALVLRELGGLSHAEIASVLAIDAAGAKQTIFEARRSLQEFAEGRAMVCDEVCRSISGGGGRALRGRRIKAHLRDCNSCRAFAEAIPSRARDLRAIAPPLAGTAATSILRRALASAPGHSGSSGVGIAAGTAGKAAAALTAGKALAGAAAVLTVAAGATGVVRALNTHPARRAAMVTRANGSTQHGAAHFRLQAIAPSDRSNRPMAEKVARTRPSRDAQKSGVAVGHRERGAGRSRSLMRGHANAGQAHSRGRTGSTRIRPQRTGLQAKTRTGATSATRGRGVSTTTTRTSLHRQTGAHASKPGAGVATRRPGPVPASRAQSPLGRT